MGLRTATAAFIFLTIASVSNRCGTDWPDANSRCGVPCEATSDCPSGEGCYADMTTSCSNACKTTAGANCVSFTHGGVSYGEAGNECTNTGHSGYWCASSVNTDSEYIEWGDCDMTTCNLVDDLNLTWTTTEAGRCADWSSASWVKTSDGGSDGGIPNPQSIDWCKSKCEAESTCTGITYREDQWCYLWGASSCTPTEYMNYESYMNSRGSFSDPVVTEITTKTPNPEVYCRYDLAFGWGIIDTTSINTYEDYTDMQCAAACDASSTCVSFNWRPDSYEMNCELKSEKGHEAGNSFQKTEDGWSYYEQICEDNAVSDKLDFCTQNPCLNGGTCTSGVTTHYCECTAAYVGGSCEATLVDHQCMVSDNPYAQKDVRRRERRHLWFSTMCDIVKLVSGVIGITTSIDYSTLVDVSKIPAPFYKIGQTLRLWDDKSTTAAEEETNVHPRCLTDAAIQCMEWIACTECVILYDHGHTTITEFSEFFQESCRTWYSGMETNKGSGSCFAVTCEPACPSHDCSENKCWYYYESCKDVYDLPTVPGNGGTANDNSISTTRRVTTTTTVNDSSAAALCLVGIFITYLLNY